MNEKTRDTLWLAVEIGSIIATGYFMIRILGGPDLVRLSKMKVIFNMERVCMSQAKTWATLADRAARSYEKCRPVNA